MLSTDFNRFEYKRLQTKEVNIGGLLLGANHPIRMQTMTTTDTMDTEATVAQTIKCIEAGAELVRITAPSKLEAENLGKIKKILNERGYHTPLVADIHFTPNAAEIAARLIEKVRVNPGNYVDKKKFELINYTDGDYQEELGRIRKRFIPLINICKEHGTAMRIGTNHGSLSDRIMSRYGDTPMGMVESAMEFLRIARDYAYHNIVLSMKASNPIVMVEAYRQLVNTMLSEFGECYPLHLGVTEAGDGEDGRIKSAIGIGSLLEDGIGDTIRVSLTEEPELEIPVCKDLIKRYPLATQASSLYIPIEGQDYFKQNIIKNSIKTIDNIGTERVPVVIADFSDTEDFTIANAKSIGYQYNESLDKWTFNDLAADYVILNQLPKFNLPGTLKGILPFHEIENNAKNPQFLPYYNSINDYLNFNLKGNTAFIFIDGQVKAESLLELPEQDSIVLIYKIGKETLSYNRNYLSTLIHEKIVFPIIIQVASQAYSLDDHLIQFAIESGGLFLEQMGNGVLLTLNKHTRTDENKLTGRIYNSDTQLSSFLNQTGFSILQATRRRISKTEYISCPSCGRTLFDLQETTSMIRNRTHHLKGVKIAIMGCIVNGPGEMADADFGYVGSGVGKITLYKGKEVVKRGIDSEIAVDELINLLKENNAWIEPEN